MESINKCSLKMTRPELWGNNPWPQNHCYGWTIVCVYEFCNDTYMGVMFDHQLMNELLAVHEAWSRKQSPYDTRDGEFVVKSVLSIT